MWSTLGAGGGGGGGEAPLSAALCRSTNLTDPLMELLQILLEDLECSMCLARWVLRVPRRQKQPISTEEEAPVGSSEDFLPCACIRMLFLVAVRPDTDARELPLG